MANKYSEQEMADKCYEYLKSCGKFDEVKQEIPVFSRCIDLVCVKHPDTDACEIVSIEFKLHDWKHAIMQAKDHKIAADKSYICLPRRKVTPEMREMLAEYGIGLLFYDPDAEIPIYEEISPPEDAPIAIPAFKKQFLRTFNNIH